MSIRKNDILDRDIKDSYELLSDGYGENSIYFDTPLISTTSLSKTLVVGLASDGNGILYTADHPVESGDIVWIHESSAADGYYTVDQVLSNLSLTVNEFINSSTGGIAQFRYKSGALNIGFDPRNTLHVTHNNVQNAIEDLDQAINGGLTPFKHEILRQLIHLADGIGGPFEGFISGAYRERSPSLINPTSIIWYTDVTKVSKIVEKTITYNAFSLPLTFEWKVYKDDGFTLLATVIDTLTYSGAFETSRVRAIFDSVYPSFVFDVNSHKIIRQLIHLADGVGGPFEGFISGAYREKLPIGSFPTSIIWYTDVTKVRKIVEKQYVYNLNYSVSSVIYKVYDVDGVTVLATSTDSISYSGAFETSRTRTIS